MESMLQWMQTLFGGAWELMSKTTVPGFGISAAKFAVGFFVIKWSLNILGLVTGFRTNAAYSAEQLRSSHETLSQYRKVSEQNANRSKLSGGMGFHP